MLHARVPDPQKGVRMESAGPDFDVIGLLQDATAPRPETLYSLDHLLESKHVVPFSIDIAVLYSFSEKHLQICGMNGSGNHVKLC